MRALIQRVQYGSVIVDGNTVSEIKTGLVILLGIGAKDSDEQVEYLVNKIANLRIFEDDEGKMNRSLLNIGGEALVVSQFTLYADTRKGRRPSFTDAAKPAFAENLVNQFVTKLNALGIATQTGIFGGDMLVKIENDGPVTIWIDH
ncbi:MAG: D-tyrosyl-tRNA(Tyr) deacylase [Chloroflexi bacterium]|nr:D-tyrosyl-tRNA(Tyr) deacylase [Chloroflexota bacterium]